MWEHLVEEKQAGYFSPWESSDLNVLVCREAPPEVTVYSVFQIYLAAEPVFMKYLLGTYVSWHTLRGNIKEVSKFLGDKLILLH